MSNRKNSVNNKIISIVLMIVQMLISIIFCVQIVSMHVLPIKYLVILILILLLIITITFLTQFSKKLRLGGRIFSVIICLSIGLGCYYMMETNKMLTSVTGIDTKIDDISIIVLKDDPAQSLEDTKDCSFGIQEVIDRDNVNKAIDNFDNDLNAKIKYITYNGFHPQIDALYNGEVRAIIINEAYRETIEDEFSDFSEKTRMLEVHKVVTDVKVEPVNKEITKNAFTVYISGIDTYGSISRTSRSDVNIIATINPITKQILLNTTPRDYYVSLPFANGAMDKLTHAGIYGVDASMETLENLYDIDIDYYVRVNFTSLTRIVDALGGVIVNSPYEFKVQGYSFNVGDNELNGDKALAFSRERHSFANGDNQRGINQTLVIKAMLNKALSPVILTKYSNIMNSISGSFETNMSFDEITSLVRMQMNDLASWNIVSNAVVGTGDSQTTYSAGSQHLYVMIPNQTSVDNAKEKMQQVISGEILK